MKGEIAQYGLRVAADYRAVDFAEGAAEWVDAETLALSGRVDVRIAHAGRLRIVTRGNTFATLTVDVAGELLVAHAGDVDGVVRLERRYVLAEGASVTDTTAVRVRGRLDLLTAAEHRARASSCFLAKIAVEDGARVIARGRIVIPREAAGSDGFERIDALLLGPSAVVDVLPTIEAATDDVRCKHAATAGSIGEDELFYLVSRGMSVDEAKRTYAEGFLQSTCLYGHS